MTDKLTDAELIEDLRTHAFDDCDGNDTTNHVATHAATRIQSLSDELAKVKGASNPEIVGDVEAKIISYDHAHEDAVSLGFPSLTEALEALSTQLKDSSDDARN